MSCSISCSWARRNWAGRAFFFRARRDSGSRLSNYLIGVLLRESLELFVPLYGLLDGRNLLSGDVAGQVFALFACLELIKGAGGTFLNDGKLAAFHGMDLGDLPKDGRQRIGMIHGQSIYIIRYFDNKKRAKYNF